MKNKKTMAAITMRQDQELTQEQRMFLMQCWRRCNKLLAIVVIEIPRKGAGQPCIMSSHEPHTELLLPALVEHAVKHMKGSPPSCRSTQHGRAFGGADGLD